jgi:hypothetical protein
MIILQGILSLNIQSKTMVFLFLWNLFISKSSKELVEILTEAQSSLPATYRHLKRKTLGVTPEHCGNRLKIKS